MTTSSNEQLENEELLISGILQQHAKLHLDNSSSATPSTTKKSTSQLLPRGKFIAHHPKAGINPLVDAAAYLFSLVGKLRQLKSYRHLARLHRDLVAEINLFQDNAKSQGYSSEYILVSRYALCATFDDIIMNMPWGAEGQWESYSLLTTVTQESAQQERFFVLLERIVKDPALYIDLMEFMYICLSLGFKGSYRATDLGNIEFEQICNALYKRIRAHHGDLSRSLSPPPVRTAPPTKLPQRKNTSVGLVLLMTACIILALFVGLGYWLDHMSNQAYQELMHLGKSILYETHDT